MNFHVPAPQQILPRPAVDAVDATAVDTAAFWTVALDVLSSAFTAAEMLASAGRPSAAALVLPANSNRPAITDATRPLADFITLYLALTGGMTPLEALQKRA